MTRHDENLSAAMHAIAPETDDVPDLFERVAGGARRRRRRHSLAVAGGVAAVVAVAALTPALLQNSSSGPNRSVTLGAPSASPTTSSSVPVATPASVSIPIADGACAPGLTLRAQVNGESTLISGGANAISATVGDSVSFAAEGACASEISYSGDGASLASVGAQKDGDFVVARSGSSVVNVTMPGCANVATQACRGGITQLAAVSLTVDPLRASDTATAADSGALPKDSHGCPTVAASGNALSSPSAAKDAIATALAAVPRLYGADAAQRAEVTAVYPANSGKGYGIVADAICGKALGDQSYVVELGFGSDSASAGSGQLFVAHFDSGWHVWFQYH
jgi:hypothetical protein